MADSRFVYVTYIRTTAEKLWQALIQPEFTRQYWFGASQESDWTPGASWRIVTPDGDVTDSGEVIEIDPPQKLVLSWQNQFKPELKAEGATRATFLLEPQGAEVKLTVIHEIDIPNSKMIEAVSNGWPHILSSLKTLLETGASLELTRQWPKGK
jgi:uncharacterized protein YndB with AHSA1/START domain